MTTKTCKDCGETYPKTPEFWHVRKRGVRRLPEYNGRCKPCHAAYLREHRRKYSNRAVVSNRPARRKKLVITKDTVWQVALHIRYANRAETRLLTTGRYPYLRYVYDLVPPPETRDFDEATEVYMALEPLP